MNASPLLLVLFEEVWKTSLVTAVLIGLVLLVQFAFQRLLRPRWCYALWLLVVLRMLMPAAPSSRFSIFNLCGPWLTWSTVNSPSVVSALRSQTQPEVLTPSLDGPGAETPLADASELRQDQTERHPIHHRPSSPLDHADLAAFLWLLGASVYLLVMLLQQWRFAHRVKRQTQIPSARLVSQVENARAMLQLRRVVQVVETDGMDAPSVFGFVRPRLLFSQSVLEKLSDQELRLVVLHELVHVQRWDACLNWLLILLQALHWFNPLVWLVMRRLRSDRELVCDAAVLRHLSVPERQVYGATLIRMLDCISHSPLVPSLVPILNQKHQIHRRITMIARFKPTTPMVAFVSALLLLTLGCLTLTSAPEKVAPAAPEKSKLEPDFAKQQELAQRGVKVLEQELAKQEVRIKEVQQKVDNLRDALHISEVGDAVLRGEIQPQSKLESLLVESKAQFVQMDSLYTYLTNLSRPNFKRAILTVVPDAPLVELINQQARMEQELTRVRDTFGDGHPEVRRVRAVWDVTNRQIDDRLEGILIGLTAKREAERTRLDNLGAEMDNKRKSELEHAIKFRPYLQAKRDLENLQLVRERLALRLIQEKIDATIPR